MIDEKTILTWLQEENLFKEKMQDGSANFHFLIHFPNPENSMDIIQPIVKKDSVIIGCATEVSPEHRQLMKGNAAEEYIWEVKYALNQFLLDFNIQVENGILKQFVITEEIFEDGLTKDSFIRAIKKIFKAKIQCVWRLEQKFGVKTVNTEDDDTMLV